jgi:uncharacterized protein YxeA
LHQKFKNKKKKKGNIMLVFAIFAIIAMIGIGVFMKEVKNAKTVDPTEPFLHDDYDPNKDETLKE